MSTATVTTTVSTHTDRGRRLVGLLLALVVLGCHLPHDAGHGAGHGHDHGAGHDHGNGHGHDHGLGSNSWTVTAWGQHFEAYPTVEPLVAGATALARFQATRLDGYEPLEEGSVEIVLTGGAGSQTFAARQAEQPGVFQVEVTPESAGDYELAFRIETAEGAEELRGGKVRVGSAEQPGGLIVAPAPRGATDGGQPQEFLKEEQWRSHFATTWVRSGRLARSVAGLARLRPPAGGEAVVTSSVNGVLRPAAGARSWPFVGQRVKRGSVLFHVLPQVAADSSLATLDAELAALTAELAAARGRVARLEELLELEAASRREVGQARLRVETLEARHAAAERDAAAAHRSREGGSVKNALHLRTPFSGEVAWLDATPGVTVAAGEPLARLVRTDAVWVEVLASPAGARQIAADGVRGVVLTGPEHGTTHLEDGVRLISVAPEASPDSGTVTVLLEVPATPGLVLGTTLEAQVLGETEREGIVIPASAVVDDGGVPVVYLQLAGERFARQQIEVLERQGERLRVAGLVPGQRLVSRGGDAIRRASLLAAGGGGHGHVH
ncbi:MAG: efflux RND transporter periplasmic adaptor subunit [Acidobacteriota bacterium]